MLFALPLLYKILAVVAIAGAIITGAYVKGRSDANSNCREAEYKETIAVLEKQLKIQKDADKFEEAATRELEADNTRLEQENQKYAETLKGRPECLLDESDIDGLFGGSR